MRTGQRKALYRMERDSLEGPQDADAMDLRAFSLGMYFLFRVEIWESKERVQSNLIPRKVGVGLKVSWIWLGVVGEGSGRKREGFRWASCGSMVKSDASHFCGLRGRRQVEDQSARQLRADCTESVAQSIAGDEDQMARSSAYRLVLTSGVRD